MDGWMDGWIGGMTQSQNQKKETDNNTKQQGLFVALLTGQERLMEREHDDNCLWS